ncbi:MAG: TetR/AcrR family transcriptional regulator [Acidimicrobiales bacterium]|nr:TetR/AcrR family transcriptional regulator [Acidimicrobiales bacterium]
MTETQGRTPEGRTQGERKAETRARLVAAAAELFARNGYHAVSTDAVAEAAGRTSGAVYAHFGGKEGLLWALLDEWERATAREIRDALAATDDPAHRVDALWSTFVRRPGGHGDPGMLLEHELWLYAARRAEAAGALAQRYQGARTALADTFGAWAAERGAHLPHGADAAATLVLALLLGLEMQRRVDPAAVPDDLAVAGLRRLLDEPEPPD